MYLYGASGHAKVILEILRSAGIEVHGLFDDNPGLQELAGIPLMGKYDNQPLPHPLIISIGDNRIRASLAARILGPFGRAIYPGATISLSAEIGEGSVIMQGAVIQAGATIGKHAIINTGASVDHDCLIGDFVHVSPAACLCGNVKVEKGTHIGAGATVIPNIRIGKWCKIGAGAVVIRNIPDHAIAVGNPARVISFISKD